MTELPVIDCVEKLEMVVQQIGFLPFFRCEVPGYSLEEHTPAALWFQKGVEGPWEWREMAAERQIIGSGTILDTARLRSRIAEYLDISQKNVYASVFG